MIAQVCVYLLLIIICFSISRSAFSKDKAQIFSPMNMYGLVFLYYCVHPYLMGGREEYILISGHAADLYYSGSLFSYICILIGFSINSRRDFKKWNHCFDKDNTKKYMLLLFSVAFIGYSSVRGIHFSPFSDGTDVQLKSYDFKNYLTELLCWYEISMCLLFVLFRDKIKMKWFYWLLLTYVIITFLFAGTRSRIVVLLLSVMTTLYLYPKPRRMNYPIVAALGFSVFLLFSIMDTSRSYSRGINFQIAKNISYEDAKVGAGESYSVSWFSGVVMESVESTGNYIYFEPIVTAIFMPIPRAIFPWKPDGGYIDRAQQMTRGFNDGAAFTIYAEGFYAFGWYGVIIYSLFLGWLAKLFWANYRRNPNMIGAVVALALFNGFTYVVISRGYLASAFINFCMLIVLPFWLVNIINKFTNKTK